MLIRVIRVPLSQHLRPLLQKIAMAHTSTKFLSIPAGMCIPNYPDRNVPTLLIYRNGDMLGNVVAGMGLNGMKTTVKGGQYTYYPVRPVTAKSATTSLSLVPSRSREITSH